MAEEDSGTQAGGPGGSQPRSLIVFCDLVGSTELSGRHDPERYGLLVRRYLAEIDQTVEEFDGEVVSKEGDGLLASFGAPRARGDDAERAVRASLLIVERIRDLSVVTEREMGEELAVRVAIHRGQVFRAIDGSIYGLATNVAARLQTLAGPNEVVVSDEVQRLVNHLFEIEPGEPQLVKGVAEPVCANRVIGELGPEEIPRRTGGPLVDRHEEWERLQSAWSDTQDRSTEGHAVFLLRGDAGIGKSYLASKLASVAVDDGASVVELTGSAFFADAGLYPVRRFVEKTCGIPRDADGPDRLARLRNDLEGRGLPADVFVPRLAPILGLEPATGYQPELMDARKLSEEIQEAAYSYIENCLGGEPSVVLAEDVHWFDGPSRDLLSKLTSTAESCAVIMTARPQFVPFGDVETLDLDPLSEQDCRILVDALCTEVQVDDLVREDVIERSDGIPLYVEELLANVRQGLPAVEPVLVSRPSGTVPDLLYDLLAARLASPPEAIPVATASAVIGRDVDQRLLQHVLDIPSAELEVALRALCAQGVLEEPTTSDGQYRFRHELLREVAYELQPPSRRKSIHSRIADALVSTAPEEGVIDWTTVAHHYEHSERRDEASSAYENAASSARLRGAFGEARGYLTKAIQLLITGAEPGVARDIREVGLRQQLGYMAFSEEGFGSTVAEAEYERCLELTASDPLGDEMFNTVVVQWVYHIGRGRLSKAREISEYTYRGLERREWYWKFNLAAFGIIDFLAGDFRDSRDLLETFRVNRRKEDEDRFVSQWFNPFDPATGVFHTLALVRYFMGALELANEAFDTAIERASATAFPQGPYSAVYCLSMESWMRWELQQFDEADDRIDLFGSIAEQHGFDGWTLIAGTHRAVAAGLRAMAAGEDAQVLAAHAAEASALIEVWKVFDVKFLLPYFLTVAGVLLAAAGDKAGASSHFEASLVMASETGMHFWTAETMRNQAQLEADVTKREARLREALELARTQFAHLLEVRIALDLADLDPAGRRDLVEVALGRFGTDPSYPEVRRAREFLAAS